jgi:hypothetical protein
MNGIHLTGNLKKNLIKHHIQLAPTSSQCMYCKTDKQDNIASSNVQKWVMQLWPGKKKAE